MPSETPTNPDMPAVRIPSAEGIVAVVGKVPIPIYLDLNRDGIIDYEQKWFRSALADGAFWLVSSLFPKAAQSQILQQARPHIDAILGAGAK